MRNFMDTLRWDDHFFDHIDIPDRLEKELLVDTIVERNGKCTPVYADPSLFHHYMNMWFRSYKPMFEEMIDTTLYEYNPIENYDRHEWSKDDHDYDIIDKTDSKNNTDTTDLVEGKGTRNNTGTSDNTTDGTVDVNTTNNQLTTDKTKTELDSNTTENTNVKVSAFDANTVQPKSETFVGTGKTDTTDVNGTSKVEGSGTDKTVSHDYEKGNTTGKEDTTNSQDSIGNSKTTAESSAKRDDMGTKEHNGYIHGNIGVMTTQAMIAEQRAIILYNVYENIANMFEDRFMLSVY